MNAFQEDFLQTIINVNWNSTYIGIYGKFVTGNNSVDPSGSCLATVNHVPFNVFGGKGVGRKITSVDLQAPAFGIFRSSIFSLSDPFSSCWDGTMFVKVTEFTAPITIHIQSAPTGLSSSNVWVATEKGGWTGVPISFNPPNFVGFSFPNLVDIRFLGNLDLDKSFTADPKTLKLTG